MTAVKFSIFLLVLTSICFSQQMPPAEVPVENEPHHHLVFENEYVRVFKVEVAPHEATLVHRHKRDYVVVTIGDAEVTNAGVGKEPKKWSFKDGDVTFLEASGEKSFAHKAVNESKRPFRNYTIEIKTGRGAASNIDTCEGRTCHQTIAAGEGFICEKYRNPSYTWVMTFPGKSRLVVPHVDSMLFSESGAQSIKKYEWRWFRGNERYGSANSLVCLFDPIKTSSTQ